MTSDSIKKIMENPEVIKLVDGCKSLKTNVSSAHVYYRDMEKQLDAPLRCKLFVVWNDENVEITEQMQLSALRSISQGDSRKFLELRHAPAIFGLLSAMCVYLDGPDQASWNWLMTDKGKDLLSCLEKQETERLAKLHKPIKCPLCQINHKSTKVKIGLTAEGHVLKLPVKTEEEK